jgi:dTDP-4-amino-4,6-dideoxygalactose transaminase
LHFFIHSPMKSTGCASRKSSRTQVKQLEKDLVKYVLCWYIVTLDPATAVLHVVLNTVQVKNENEVSISRISFAPRAIEGPMNL